MAEKNFINLETLAGGAFAEKLNEAFLQVAENIQNPNTDATAKRGITVNIKFAPNKARQLVNTSISVNTKLVPAEAIDTQMIMGVDAKTKKLEVAEYNGLPNGQISLDEYLEEETEELPTSKPIDLRERIVPVDGRAAKA